MLKNAILRQKEEKKVFILNDFVVRQKEQEKDVYLKSNLIKVVLGPRRAGKSVFLSRILKDINYAYFNFEDEVVNSKEFTTYDLMEKLHEVYGEFKFVFFEVRKERLCTVCSLNNKVEWMTSELIKIEVGYKKV